MNVTVSGDAATKLRTLLSEEEENSCIRIRETKVGTACKSRLELRLSFDERDDEDMEGEAESLPFIINQDLAEQYGTNFSVSLDEHGMPVVAAQN
jgi:Fe-S cluster assembly iron-binding protein IscA